jgi:hypothetical protein
LHVAPAALSTPISIGNFRLRISPGAGDGGPWKDLRLTRWSGRERFTARDERLSTGEIAFNYQLRIPTKPVRRRCHVVCHASHVCVDRGDRRHHGSPRGDQTPHGGRETRDPFAGFESLVDEGGGERARQPNPEHDPPGL